MSGRGRGINNKPAWMTRGDALAGPGPPQPTGGFNGRDGGDFGRGPPLLPPPPRNSLPPPPQHVSLPPPPRGTLPPPPRQNAATVDTMRAAKQNVPLSLPKVPIARLVGHEGPIQNVQFAANGKYCLTGGHDRTVRLWNPLRIDPAFPPSTTSLPPLPGGDPTALSLESIARALPIQTYVNGYTHPISALAMDSSSTTLLAGSNKTVIVTDVITQQVKRRFQGHVGRINAVAMSEGCETYLSASYDATVKIWDGRSHNSYEPIMSLGEAKDSVTDIHVVQDASAMMTSKGNNNSNSNTALIRTASVDGIVRTYDIRKGCLSNDDCHSAITDMAPTCDGQCLAVNCLDGVIRLMELESGQLLNTYSGSHQAGQYGLHCAMTSDDATLVTGSEDGNAVMYDIVRGTAIQTLQGHSRPTCSIATHPKQDYSSVVITASYDGLGIVWGHDEGYMKWED